MATPDLALLRAGYRELTRDSSEFACSYDLNGNIIEVNGVLERISGYSRDEALEMNLRQLLDAESWEVSREQVREQVGGGPPQNLNINLVTKDGQRVQVEITRRLLFEQGRPVAVLDRGLSTAEAGSWQNEAALHEAEERLSVKSMELAQFTEQLKQLHRLSTTSYPTLERAFDDHLSTGSRLFDLAVGMILRVEGGTAVVHAVHGSPDLRAGKEIPLRSTHGLTVAGRLRTMTASEPVAGDELYTEFEIYIGTPIWVGTELFGTLSFSSTFGGVPRLFTAAEKEVVELMARSLGRCVLEHRMHAERKKIESLEKSRNRVLEMVAENHALEAILEQVVHMVEGQRPESLCSLLLLKDEGLAWATAPSFPPQTIRLFKPVRVLRDTSDLKSAEVSRSTVFWDDVRRCPFWAERAHFAGQIGVEACLSAPIRSADGALFGMVVLHYRRGETNGEEDRDLLQLAGRLAAIAIEQRRLTDGLAFQARHDSLTGLPNRSFFLELLKEALLEARERSGSLAVLFIDLDRFKQINDTLGHAMGDRLLKEVGERLKRLLTEDDLAGRMGGDEFTIVLTRQPDEQTAIHNSREFLNAFRAPHRIDENELFVTASIGVAVFPTHGCDSAELMRNADLAMYHAKNNGKNDVEVFRAEGHASGLERLRLENALRRALEHDEFELLYQPVVSMNGKVEGVEALLTWRHPVYGTISPNQFIPIAEETGLIIEFGSWVIRTACLEAARWHEAGHHARVSVNVSALQFERRDFVETVATALALSGLPPECLELELTESYVMRDLQQAMVRMSQIRDLGISIAIDDFGTGYSSLSYLNRLPVDCLKIDQSFLRSLQEPEGSLPVVQSIVRLAHSMNLTVVAEGVETRQELDLVRVLGCDKVQGHVYGPALRGEQVEALLARNDAFAPILR
jgi:diguanylate cyclase (GGDEF)-like protein/PAS domain S-box-containing protein